MTTEQRATWDKIAELVTNDNIRRGHESYLPGMRLLQAKRNTGARGVVWLAKGDITIGYTDAEDGRISVFSPRPIWNPKRGQPPKGLENAIVGWCVLPSNSAVEFLVPLPTFRVKRVPMPYLPPGKLATLPSDFIFEVVDDYGNMASSHDDHKSAIMAAFELNYPVENGSGQ